MNLADMLEKDWQAQVIETARLLGYRHFHTYRSTRSPEGFPDLVLVGRRVIFVELKREKTQPTDRQKHWLTMLHNAGAEVYLARPRHLQALTTVLSTGLWTTDPKHSAARSELVAELRNHLLEGA